MLGKIPATAGGVLARISPPSHVCDPRRGPVRDGNGGGLADRPVAGKTGTAENYQDAWFCGFVPQLATCVWVGYPAGEIPLLERRGSRPVFGGTLPAAIWRDFMAPAVAPWPIKTFPTPTFGGDYWTSSYGTTWSYAPGYYPTPATTTTTTTPAPPSHGHHGD